MASFYVLCAVAGCAFGFIVYMLTRNIYIAILVTMAVSLILTGFVGWMYK